jgi:hypothetical protein
MMSHEHALFFADFFISHFGARAEAEMKVALDEANRQGDNDLASTWQRIIDAIGRRRTMPKPHGAAPQRVHRASGQ